MVEQPTSQVKVSEHHQYGMRVLLTLSAMIVLALIISLFTPKANSQASPLHQIIPPAVQPATTTSQNEGFTQRYEQLHQPEIVSSVDTDMDPTDSTVIAQPNQPSPKPLSPAQQQQLAWEAQMQLTAYQSRQAPLFKPRSDSKALPELSSHPTDTQHRQPVFTITPGTLIEGMIDQDILSDHPGGWLAHVTQDVYDVSGQLLLIPNGSKILGRSAKVSETNKMVAAQIALMADQLILPNGKIIKLKQMVSSMSGYSAVPGHRNAHLLSKVSGAMLYALLSVSLPAPKTNAFGVETHDHYATGLAQALRTQAQQAANPYLQTVPSVTVVAGTPIKLLVAHTLELQQWSQGFDDAH